MKRSGIALLATAGLAGGLLVAQAPASAVTCDQWIVSSDPGTVTAAEFDQMREGMTYEQVQTLFGSPGAITYASEFTTSKLMTVKWTGAVSLRHWTDWIDDSEVEATFSMDKATTQTKYKRKKVKVKNVKRAKRLGLRTWRWKTVKVKKRIPATPYTVDYFSLYGAEVLRQTKTLDCSTY